MKKSIFLFAFILSFSGLKAQTDADTVRHEVLLQTTMGDIRVCLYNETPQHRDNFIKLVKEGYYDNTLFHRVIYKFMIQGGDSTSRHVLPNEPTGLYSPDYTIPAEIDFPKLFHKRGALAAARESDAENPERASSASQFYIVYGQRFNDEMLDKVQMRIDSVTDGKVKLSPEVREIYKQKGGTPHLDGQYTVFGEVVEGLKIVNEIQMSPTDEKNRPKTDVRILKATLLK